MVKLLEQGEDALVQRLGRVQFKMLRPLVWKHLLDERSQGFLSTMGLSMFFRTDFAAGDEALCRQFLRSYNKNDGSGAVRGHIIHTDPRMVHIVLKLPRSSLLVKDAPKPSPDELHSMYGGPPVKVPHNGYSVKSLFEPGFKEFVGFLVDRFSCKVNGGYVGSEILNAAKYVWDTKDPLDWAAYMSQRIQGQCEKVRGTTQCSFEYTQYLTEIIRFQLGMYEHGVQEQPQVLNECGIGLELALVEPRQEGGGEQNGYPLLEDDHVYQEKKRRRSSSGQAQAFMEANAMQLNHAYQTLGKAMELQIRDLHTRVLFAEKRVRELEAELKETTADLQEMNTKYQAEVQKQVHFEVENNVLLQEKAVLKEQVEDSVGKQASLRQQLDTSEREKDHLRSHVTLFQNKVP